MKKIKQRKEITKAEKKWRRFLFKIGKSGKAFWNRRILSKDLKRQESEPCRYLWEECYGKQTQQVENSQYVLGRAARPSVVGLERARESMGEW